MELFSRYIDETFDINNCNNYILSIQFSLDGFSFAIFEPIVKKFIVVSAYRFIAANPFTIKNEIDSIFENESILNYSYKKVFAVYLNNKATITPISLADKSVSQYLHDFVFETERDDVVLTRLGANSLKVIFSIPKLLKDQIEHFFPNVEFCSSYCPIIRYASCQFSNNNSQLYVLFNGHQMQLVAIKNKQVEACNAFFIKADSDALYYLLNFVNCLNETKNSEVIIMGKSTFDSDLLAKLKNYFEKVKYASLSDGYHVSYTMLKEKPHIYLALIEQALCE